MIELEVIARPPTFSLPKYLQLIFFLDTQMCVITNYYVTLVGAIALWRTKDMAFMGLHPKTVETLYVELSGEEC